jgi:hypothetical protein
MEQKAATSPKSDSLAATSFEELAASQCVQPLTDFNSLLGHQSAEDESTEDFAALLREWRREGAA